MQSNNKLTPIQEKAVKSTSPATLVIAGPGTGKTHIIASRIQHLVQEKHVNPKHILCVSFTNAGAIAMKQRIISMIGETGYSVTVSTFHSFASQLIQEYPDSFGYQPDATPITDLEKIQYIRTIVKKLRGQKQIEYLTHIMNEFVYCSNISYSISKIKQDGITPQQFTDYAEKEQKEFENMLNELPDDQKFIQRGPKKDKQILKQTHEQRDRQLKKNKELALAYQEYERVLQKNNSYDYEDMIQRVWQTLTNNPSLLDHIQKQYPVLLVDEYQDTNGGQNKILSLLVQNNNQSCFVVGDDDQAIYKFQGANLQNFFDLQKQFTDIGVDINIITLEDNFRSPQLILDASLELIAHNTQRITQQLSLPDKKLIARGTTASESTTQIYELATDTDEYIFIIEQLQNIHKATGAWNSCAILTRSNKEHSAFIQALNAYSIPYNISSTQSVLHDQRIISLLTILKAHTNPTSNLSLASYVLHQSSPIKPADAYRLLTYQRKQYSSLSLYEKIHALLKEQVFEDPQAVQQTVQTLEELSRSKEHLSGVEWMQSALQQTKFFEWVLQQDDALVLIESIRTLLEEAERFQKGKPHLSIQDILEHFRSFEDLNISLQPNLSGIKIDNAVEILTAHKAKGLEFDYVFIPHTTENIWEGKRKIAQQIPLLDIVSPQQQDEEDERRLFFVALTRAKKQALVSYTRTITETQKDVLPSKFITEISNHIPTTSVPPKEHEEFLVKTTLESKNIISQDQKQVIQQIVTDPSFALSATGINVFLESPEKFLYERILRIPTETTPTLNYGNAIHLALQQYFDTPNNQNIDSLIQTATQDIQDNSLFNKNITDDLVKRAEEALTKYFHSTLTNEPTPLFCEKNYPAGIVSFQDVRLTGKIDKISPLPDSQSEVRVVDYKTGLKKRTLSAIYGNLKSDKYSIGLYRQLMFYKLLLDSDTTFSYKATQFTLDFVEQQVQIDVPIQEEDYIQFQNTVQEIWRSIQSLAFLTPNKDSSKL